MSINHLYFWTEKHEHVDPEVAYGNCLSLKKPQKINNQIVCVCSFSNSITALLCPNNNKSDSVRFCQWHARLNRWIMIYGWKLFFAMRLQALSLCVCAWWLLIFWAARKWQNQESEFWPSGTFLLALSQQWQMQLITEKQCFRRKNISAEWTELISHSGCGIVGFLLIPFSFFQILWICQWQNISSDVPAPQQIQNEWPGNKWIVLDFDRLISR